MKICTNCSEESDNFSPDKRKEDGFSSWCRECRNKQVDEYKKTKNGLVSKIYASQCCNSKVRRDLMPTYIKQELKEWLFNQMLFHKLYDDWKANNYKTDLIPSVDRLNDYKPYTLENIQLITWGENNKKGCYDRKKGINNKLSKEVVQHDLNGNKIARHHSLNEAERKTSVSHGDISKCCNNKRKTAGGYKWAFVV